MLDGNGAGPGFWNCMGLTGASSYIPGPMSRQASAAKLHLVMQEPGERFNYELLARHVPQQCHSQWPIILEGLAPRIFFIFPPFLLREESRGVRGERGISLKSEEKGGEKGGGGGGG